MNRRMNRPVSIAVSLGAGMLVGGCATAPSTPTPEHQPAAVPVARSAPVTQAPAAAPATAAAVPRSTDFIASQPAALQPYLRQLYSEGERNAVLNFNRLAVAAMANHEYDIARKALDQSIQRIDAFRTSGSDLKYAKSKFGGEANKDFKGEPYERGMTFYYRGLVYLHDGDISNAAASFARVNVEDSQADGEAYRADYSSMKFLQAWALKCQGEPTTSASLYGDAKSLREDLAKVNYQSPVVLIFETGAAPRKTGTGKFNEKLSFADAGGDAATPNASLGDTALDSPVRAESLFFQASTRGGRPVEYVLAGKASFKSGAETASNVASGVAVGAMTAANIQSAQGNYNGALASSYLGLASSLFSLASSAMANAAQPAADTRAWESVPGSIWLETPNISPGQLASVKASRGGSGQPPDLLGGANGCAAAWYRLSPVAPPQADPVEKIDATSEAKARLAKFQTSLQSVF